MRVMYCAHGDQVPLDVRTAAVVAFLVARILGIDQSHMRIGEAQELWSSRAFAFCDSAVYVAQRLSTFHVHPNMSFIHSSTI